MEDIRKEYLPVKENTSGTTHLRIAIYYDLGGYDFCSYTQKPRGYYLAVTPVHREKRNGCTMESFAAFSGYKSIIKAVARKSRKAEAEALGAAETIKTSLINAVLNENHLALA